MRHVRTAHTQKHTHRSTHTQKHTHTHAACEAVGPHAQVSPRRTQRHAAIVKTLTFLQSGGRRTTAKSRKKRTLVKATWTVSNLQPLVYRFDGCSVEFKTKPFPFNLYNRFINLITSFIFGHLGFNKTIMGCKYVKVQSS